MDGRNVKSVCQGGLTGQLWRHGDNASLGKGPVGRLTVRIVVQQLRCCAYLDPRWELGLSLDLFVDEGLDRGHFVLVVAALERSQEHVAVRVVVDDEFEGVSVEEDEVAHGACLRL